MGEQAKQGGAKRWAEQASLYDGDDCLLWPFSTTRGYGTVWNGVRTMPAHRYVCSLAHGSPPAASDCAHSCGNRLCCNPKHLRWATRAENEADKIKHGKDNRGQRHGLSKLTNEQVLAIKAKRRAGMKRKDLALEYNLKPATIYDITSGRRWQHLDGEV